MVKAIGQIFLFVMILVLLSAKCKKDEDVRPRYFYIKNNSNAKVYFALSFNYPDFTMANLPKPSSGNYVFSGEETSLGNPDMFNLNATIQLFIINKDTFELKPWDSIKNQNNYLKRYEFNEATLKNTNWIINYP